MNVRIENTPVLLSVMSSCSKPKSIFCLYLLAVFLLLLRLIIKSAWSLQRLYTKTDLVFGFKKNQSLVARQNDEVGQAVIPGLESAEDFTRGKLFLDYCQKQF